MLQNRKSGAPLLLAGLAAFAYYKYSKLSPEQKQDLSGTIKEKGKQVYDKFVPQSVRDMFGKKRQDEGYVNT